MSAIMIYITCAGSEEAEKIASHLLDRGLVACANIMAPHRAIYKWQGKVENAQETAMIVKTREGLFEQVRAEICAMHSYECPCIVAVPLVAGHEPFLQWINEQTG